jgi:hypothetical protein
MLRFWWAVAAGTVLAAGVAPRPVRAQQWNDSTTRALVERAVERREQQLADTGLVDYRAEAHGYLTFLAQVGQGYTELPRILKADQLALEVYWKAPNLSKQRILGRRDTLLLPTDIQYHRDHLGIVQNNFPSIIRLGEGDEVRDVPHPLSRQGLHEYQFAIRDSLSMRLPTGTLQVYQVAVRPRDIAQPRIVGALYIDRATAQVVRMAFNFTRPSYLDAQLDDISVVLENALVQGRFWLPRRQEIEIRRTGTWLDFPVRGIIRGRWEICCYSVNSGLQPGIFAGPEIVQSPRSVLARHHWEGRILDSLPPDARAATEEDVERVKAEARELVQAQALQRASGATLSARRLSDFARVNRVEGLALGAGTQLRFGAGMSASIVGRWGISDHEAKGRASFEVRRATGPSVTLFASRDYQEMGDVAESSMLVNSLAAQEMGTDRTDLYDSRAAGASVELGRWHGLLWRIEGSHQEQDRLRVHATPWKGSYEPTVPAWSITEERLALGIERPLSMAFWGTELRARSELRWGWFDGRDTSFTTRQQYYGRAFADIELQRPIGDDRLVLRTTLGAVSGTPDVPAQDYIFLGGPVTAPGYDYHRFAGTFGASQRIEWRTHVPFVSIVLGPYGRAPGYATLAPYFHTTYISGSAPFAERARGWYPSLGVGAYVLFDLVRFDVARGLRDGRWTFSVDLTRELWGIL